MATEPTDQPSPDVCAWPGPCDCVDCFDDGLDVAGCDCEDCAAEVDISAWEQELATTSSEDPAHA